MDIASIGGADYSAQVITSLNQESKTTASFEDTLKNAQATGNSEEIMNACRSFESYFLQIMFRQMRQTSAAMSENTFLPVGRAEETFRDMLDEEYAKKASDSNGIGLAQFMYRQMTRGLQMNPIATTGAAEEPAPEPDTAIAES